MRTFIALAVVVAIGLIWSVAAMSKLVPVPIADMETAATSPDASSGTTGQGKRASSEWLAALRLPIAPEVQALLLPP